LFLNIPKRFKNFDVAQVILIYKLLKYLKNKEDTPDLTFINIKNDTKYNVVHISRKVLNIYIILIIL